MANWICWSSDLTLRSSDMHNKLGRIKWSGKCLSWLHRNTRSEEYGDFKFGQNSLLVFLGILGLSVLSYQLPRWANGLDPTFVHPKSLAQSSLPFLLKLATIHPLVWIALVVASFARICSNYGWKLRR